MQIKKDLSTDQSSGKNIILITKSEQEPFAAH